VNKIAFYFAFETLNVVPFEISHRCHETLACPGG